MNYCIPQPSDSTLAYGSSSNYAFTSGWLGDRMITRYDPDLRHFAEAARRLAPDTTVLLNSPGGRVSITQLVVFGPDARQLDSTSGRLTLGSSRD